MERFQDKVVIVTGGGSGIGEGIARRFSAEGRLRGAGGPHAREAGGRGRDAAARAHAGEGERRLEVPPGGSAGRGRRAQVRPPERDCQQHRHRVRRQGDRGFAQGMGADHGTKAGGVFHGCRAAMPHLVESRGCIVNMASVSGLGGDWSLSFYNAPKGAIINFTRALALDHGRDGVRVNAVAPSFTLTPMTEDMQGDRKLLSKFRERMPLGSPATPADIAGAVAFLARDDAAMITGVCLPVVGGVTASNGQPAVS